MQDTAAMGRFFGRGTWNRSPCQLCRMSSARFITLLHGESRLKQHWLRCAGMASAPVESSPPWIYKAYVISPFYRTPTHVLTIYIHLLPMVNKLIKSYQILHSAVYICWPSNSPTDSKYHPPFGGSRFDCFEPQKYV